jgi:murein L,D-transpeptidase YcbB/YkuD
VAIKKHLALLCVSVLLVGCSYWNQSNARESEALKAKAESLNVGQIVRSIYVERDFRPIWIVHGKKQPKLQQLLELVSDSSHGVHPDSSEIDKFRREDIADPAQFDIDVTTALVNYSRALARKDANVEREVKAAIDSNAIAQLADRLAPIHPEYARLRAALQTAPEAEREQIELNMDRWRELPDDLGARHIRVNVPAFDLEVHDGPQIPLRMKVVVGDNWHKTPLFSSDMKAVIFSPYWNIPESILTKETLPKIKADPSYATKQHYEVVRVSGKRVEVLDPDEIDWQHVLPSEIQLRQRPGAANSLGLVKFLFPNPYNVYLHDTPADKLFGRLARNLSHGCIRLEKPEELAEYVLRDQPEWSAQRIRNAMHAGEERQVALKDPIPVHIFYFTAWVDEGGSLHLEKDIYGYDTP